MAVPPLPTRWCSETRAHWLRITGLIHNKRILFCTTNLNPIDDRLEWSETALKLSDGTQTSLNFSFCFTTLQGPKRRAEYEGWTSSSWTWFIRNHSDRLTRVCACVCVVLHRSLLQQLQSLQAVVAGKVPKSCRVTGTQTSSCLMVLPSMRLWWNIDSNIELKTAACVVH